MQTERWLSYCRLCSSCFWQPSQRNKPIKKAKMGGSERVRGSEAGLPFTLFIHRFFLSCSGEINYLSTRPAPGWQSAPLTASKLSTTSRQGRSGEGGIPWRGSREGLCLLEPLLSQFQSRQMTRERNTMKYWNIYFAKKKPWTDCVYRWIYMSIFT